MKPTMKLMRLSVLSAMLLLAMQGQAEAQFENTPLDPKTVGGTIGELNPFRTRPQIDPLPEEQGLWFTNNTNERVYISVMYLVAAGGNSAGALQVIVEPQWVIRGWYAVDPGRSVQVVSGDLQVRYYYFHAHSRSRTWGGNPTYLVDPRNAFTYDPNDASERQLAQRRGYVRRGFQRIDTGDYTGYTLNLNN